MYPGLVALLVASVTFPKGLGQFMAADINTHDQVRAVVDTCAHLPSLVY